MTVNGPYTTVSGDVNGRIRQKYGRKRPVFQPFRIDRITAVKRRVVYGEIR